MRNASPARAYISQKRFLFSLWALLLLAAAATGCATPAHVADLDRILQQQDLSRPAVYGYRCTVGAHRGASEAYLENTAAALLAADGDDQYAFIEFDVQYAGDGRIVVYHDKRLLRLFGRLKAIGDTTYAELSELTRGEIAAYDEVMPALKKKLNIEIKSQGDPEEDARLVDEIMADLRSRNRHKDVMLSSISADVVAYVKRQYPEMPAGQIFWLTSSTYLHFDGLTRKLYAQINATRADYLMLHVANLRNIDALLKLKPRGKTIVFWDFDDTIYIVHKDLTDRLWGTSPIANFFQHLGYTLASPFQRSGPSRPPGAAGPAHTAGP